MELKLCVIVLLVSAKVIATKSLPLETEEDFHAHVRHENQSVLVVFHVTWQRHARNARKDVMEAMESIDRPNFHLLDVDCEKHVALCKAHHVNLRSLPQLHLWVYGQGPSVYGYADHTKENILTLLDEHLAIYDENKQIEAKEAAARGLKARNHVHPDPGNVVELTADVFFHLVHDADKTCFILFYSKHCDFCKEVTPLFEQLAKYYKKTTSVLIARIDGDANPKISEKYKISGFPTMKLFPKGDYVAGGIEYQGRREIGEMARFVDMNHGNHPIDGMPHPVLPDHEGDEFPEHPPKAPGDESDRGGKDFELGGFNSALHGEF